MKLTVCQELGYLTVSDNRIVKTKEFSETVLIDIDEKGETVGIEFLDITEALDISKLSQTTGVSFNKLTGLLTSI